MAKQRPEYGIAAVVSDDFRWLIRIEDLRRRRSLTPWIRRRESAPVDVRAKFFGKSKSALLSVELRPFVEAARGVHSAPPDVRVHAVGESYVLHASTDNQLSSCVISKSGADLRFNLQRFQKLFGAYRVTLITDQMIDVLKIFALQLTNGIAVEAERVHERRFRRGREIRDILILTNISGSALPALEANLAFWSKGMTGYRFRHIYGQLTARRVESALVGREWDCIVYRGHASAAGGAFVWNLSDGQWLVPRLACALYLHSACLAGPEHLNVGKLPAERVLTPLQYLPDFDDANLVSLLLTRYQITGSVSAAIRGVQSVYPQFVSFSSGG